MKTIASGALLLAALCSPLCVMAKDHDDHRDDHRYYDSGYKDYHVWNADEEREYRRYLEERHRKYQDWNRANKREQSEYWKWRHEHSR